LEYDLRSGGGLVYGGQLLRVGASVDGLGVVLESRRTTMDTTAW
jgi:hypothetical protein